MSTPISPTSTRWVRAPRIPTATRTDGYTIQMEGNRWVVIAHGVPQELRTAGVSSYVEAAIEEVDLLFPPTPWVVYAGVWTADLWQVRPNGDGTWGVHRVIDGVVEVASRQPFPSADRARRWAELRFDRGDARLRGPKPRAGSKATQKLPDVRVTEDEKAHTLAVLERLGASYSDFVRATLLWVEENALGDDSPWVFVRDESGAPRLVPVEDIE